ncbi:MAG: S8 family serine peptidase, partial [Gammaproteobacteria bacterium]|nr:S8 family serine peptidase [Gammaproteobacteria bacterium]
LTVGAASNTGDIAVFSSRGPTADGRLMPKIVGTGVAVLSPRGGGSTGRYFLASGTSMASPSVAGVAALVMDAIPELKEEPAAVRARLMASAIKPDAFLGDDAAFPLDNTNGPGTFNNAYGLGKVSARTAVLSRDDEDGWIGGSASFDIDEDSHAYHDIVVPEGASRLDIVMTWDEPPAEVITTPVLHDLDLWVDRGASCGNVAACGKYTSRSRVDNVEWVIVPNPPAGVYRLKVLPNRIYGPAPRAGLAWTVIRGDSSPSLGVAVDREVIEVAPDVPFEVDVTVSSDAYVAAGANLRVECRTAVGSTACDAFNLEGAQLPFSRDDSSLVREDALERSLARDVLIALGELGPDEQQNVSLKFAGQPEGSFRLHIAAASWNGAGGDASVAVIVGDSDQPAPVQRPPNDDFAMAIELDSEGGETTFDLMAATPDPGEPTLEIGGLPTRPRSLWYVWTAPETGLAQFAVARSTLDDYADLVVVDAFRDAPLAGLAAIGGTQLGGGKTFFAERGETYRIRLSVDTRLLFSTPPPQQRPQERRSLSFPELVLRWGPGSRPDNDDYAFAADLQGENGVVAGTGQGATTEPAEFMGHSNADYPEDTGGWLSSVWYRWTAPSTGDFVFYVNRASQAVAVFAGDSLSGARMVSGAPFFEVVFPATEGVEYRIGVANRDADWAGTDFELGWAPDERINPGNDDFAAAAQTFGDSAFTPVDFNTMTVEHGEPDASGVRTAWWVWQPSADGRYTWLAERLGGFQKDDAPLNRAAFAGDELHTLEAVAVRDGSEGFAEQLVFDARADTAYRFALGLPRDAAQTSLEPGYVSMRWGPTPENDDFANAVALTGMSGSVGGSNEFATNEKGERTGTLGDSSLWWTFQSDESGWVRFVVDGPPGSKLAIYRMNADADIELLRVSRDLGEVAATVHVEAGETYVLRLGSYYCDADGCGIGSRGAYENPWRP